MQRSFFNSTRAAFAPETDAGQPVTIVPAHAANAPTSKPEPAAAQPIVGIDAVNAITNADAAGRATLAAKLAAKRLAASTTAPTTKPANAKAAAKRVAAKPANAKPAKPTAEARAKQQADESDARRLARSVASAAVAQFYSGISKPFKASSDRFADLNPSNAKAPSVRQAGLLLALITYGAGNMRADGSFVRGGFIVPAKLINPNAKPGDTIRAQPESGCLGNMLGRAVDYVSGPRTGKQQAEAVFRLRPAVALAEIASAFGDKQRNAAAKLLAGHGRKAA